MAAANRAAYQPVDAWGGSHGISAPVPVNLWARYRSDGLPLWQSSLYQQPVQRISRVIRLVVVVCLLGPVVCSRTVSRPALTLLCVWYLQPNRGFFVGSIRPRAHPGCRPPRLGAVVAPLATCADPTRSAARGGALLGGAAGRELGGLRGRVLGPVRGTAGHLRADQRRGLPLEPVRHAERWRPPPSIQPCPATVASLRMLSHRAWPTQITKVGPIRGPSSGL